jgi:hypothetical protein
MALEVEIKQMFQYMKGRRDTFYCITRESRGRLSSRAVPEKRIDGKTVGRPKETA